MDEPLKRDSSIYPQHKYKIITGGSKVKRIIKRAGRFIRDLLEIHIPAVAFCGLFSVFLFNVLSGSAESFV